MGLIKNGEQEFLKLNNDKDFYRINLNKLRSCVSNEKQNCSIEAVFGICMRLSSCWPFEAALGWEEVALMTDINTQFFYDKGFFLFIKTPPSIGLGIEGILNDWFCKHAEGIRICLKI